MARRTPNTARARSFLLREAAEDHVGFWVVLWILEDLMVPDDLKEGVLQVLYGLLEDGRIVAGFPNGRLDFERWDLSPEETISRIRREWDALGRDPDIAEIAWFFHHGAGARGAWTKETRGTKAPELTYQPSLAHGAPAHPLGCLLGGVRRLLFGPSSFVEPEAQNIGNFSFPECALGVRILPIEPAPGYRCERVEPPEELVTPALIAVQRDTGLDLARASCVLPMA